MQALVAPHEDRSQISQMLITLFGHWQLSTSDSLQLLGMAPNNRTALANYRRGKPIANERDRLERAGNLLGIHKTLRLLFPHDRQLAYAWMTTPNRAFKGQTPVSVIIDKGLMGYYIVRAYLDRQRGQ